MAHGEQEFDEKQAELDAVAGLHAEGGEDTGAGGEPAVVGVPAVPEAYAAPELAAAWLRGWEWFTGTPPTTPMEYSFADDTPEADAWWSGAWHGWHP